MAYEYKFDDANEEIVADLWFTESKSAIRIGVTNLALFLPRTRSFAVKDPLYLQRVAFNQVREVRVRRTNPFAIYLFSLVLIAVGGAVTWLMFAPLMHGDTGKFSAVPIVLVLAGLILPFLANRRYGLYIGLISGSFSWKPRFAIDKASRAAAEQYFTNVASACRAAGLFVVDERFLGEAASGDSGGSYGKYPVGRPKSTTRAGVPQTCRSCSKQYLAERWDSWNGFIVRCPYCGEVNGKAWSPKSVLYAGLFFNALSFFFVMRAKCALLFALPFGVLAALLFTDVVFPNNQLAQMIVAGILVLSPVVINGVMAVRHNTALTAAKSISLVKKQNAGRL